jgi:hypothetical protein
MVAVVPDPITNFLGPWVNVREGIVAVCSTVIAIAIVIVV